MKTEIARLARHLLPPAIAYAVAKGWVPTDLQQPLVEAGITLVAVATAYMASHRRDARRNP